MKTFEQHNRLLPGCWAVIRLDGRSFTKFAKLHNFEKPNDKRALELCNAAARTVMSSFDNHIIFAYGESDEYSFILKRESELFSRREDKILSTVVSLFTSAYVMQWNCYMKGVELVEAPCFDGRIVLYPTTKHMRDYLAWRQADTHVNNLFNTTFWALVNRGDMTTQQAEVRLKGTLAKEKHEILFSRFGINYNDEHEMFRKGSFIMKKANLRKEKRKEKRKREKNDCQVELDDVTQEYVVVHTDIIADGFWVENEDLLRPSDLTPPRVRKAK